MRDFLGQIVSIIIVILSMFTIGNPEALDLRVVNEPITTETAVVEVVEIEWTNNTKKLIRRPYISCVEKKIDGQWCEVGNKDYAHIEMEELEYPKAKYIYKFNFEFRDIEPEAGEYRVTFEYEIKKYIGENEKYEKSIVFEVTE